jgi:DASH complex subunit DAM1
MWRTHLAPSTGGAIHMSRVPPTTPLRRVSVASIYALARSQSEAPGAGVLDPDASSYDPSAPASVAFLGPALGQLADEAEALVENMQQTTAATDALERFNEGFAAYLYMMQMNAFTGYFPQVRHLG